MNINSNRKKHLYFQLLKNILPSVAEIKLVTKYLNSNHHYHQGHPSHFHFYSNEREDTKKSEIIARLF